MRAVRQCIPPNTTAAIHATLVGALHQPDDAWAAFRARPTDNSVLDADASA